MSVFAVQPMHGPEQEQTMQKSTRRSSPAPRTARRSRANPARPALKPRISRLEGDVELVAPPGYHASVLL
jgi:hypothetical protein